MSTPSEDVSGCPSYEELATYAQDESCAAAVDGHVRACPECLREVKLMREDAQAVSRVARYLLGADAPSDAADRPVTSAAGVAIDGYVLQGEIARGAQGIVYRAVQERTNRTVAIKVLREGLLGSSRARLRFEREVEIVAALHHPNIVTVHHAVLVGGAQALVMEHIEGVPLTQWAAGLSGREDVRTRLGLFVRVCDAVVHAHQHGVIHRDLKPSNILVDGSGEPRLLDFGIAKPLAETSASPLAGGTLAPEQTHTGEFAGTLAYASPEQVAGDPRRIGTASDVYSLGVVMYEFLTRRMPYPIEGTMLEVARRIETAPPVRASTFCPHVDAELDAILLTSLEKDPSRRYGSVLAMKEDIERYLAGLPLVARRTHTGYVLRKWMWRHKAAVIGSCVLIGALVAATVVSISFAVRARHARAETDVAMASVQDRSEMLERQAYEGHIFAAQECVVAMDASGLAHNLRLAEQAPARLRGWEWEYLNGQLSNSERVFGTQWAGGVFDTALSDDGRWAVTSGGDGHVRVWDLSTPSSCREPAVLWRDEHVTQRAPVAITPDGQLIAYADARGIVRMRNRLTGDQHPLLLWSGAPLWDIDFSLDGGVIVSCCDHGLRRRSHVASGAEEDVIAEPLPFFGLGPLAARAVVLSRDGTRMVTGFANGWIVMRDMSNQSLVWKRRADPLDLAMYLGGTGRLVSAVALSDDGQRVASVHADGTVRVWNAESGAMLRTLGGYKGLAQAVEFIPGTGELLVGSSDGLVRWWNPETSTVKRTFFGLGGSVGSLCCTRTGPRRFVASCATGMSRLWSLDTPEPVRPLLSDGLAVKSLACSSSSDLIYTTAGSEVRAWNTRTGELNTMTAARKGTGRIGAVGDLLVNGIGAIAVGPGPGGDRMVTVHADGSVKEWENGEVVATLMRSAFGPRPGPHDPALSGNGRYVVASLAENGIVWWDLEKSEKPVYRRFPGCKVIAAAFTPDSTQVVVLTSDNTLTFLDCLDTDRVVRSVQRDFELSRWSDRVRMSYDPAGERLAVPSGNDIVVLDAGTLEPVFRCVGHSAGVGSARFSPDGARIVSASADSTVRLWDAFNGDRRLMLRRHEQGVLDAIFSPDGRMVISRGRDGNALVWESAPGPAEARALRTASDADQRPVSATLLPAVQDPIAPRPGWR